MTICLRSGLIRSIFHKLLQVPGKPPACHWDRHHNSLSTILSLFRHRTGRRVLTCASCCSLRGSHDPSPPCKSPLRCLVRACVTYQLRRVGASGTPSVMPLLPASNTSRTALVPLTGESAIPNQYSCVAMYHICSFVRVFDPNYAAAHITPALVDQLNAITPLASHGLLNGMQNQLPSFPTILAAANAAPAFDKTDVEGYIYYIHTGVVAREWQLFGHKGFGSSHGLLLLPQLCDLRARLLSPQDHVWRPTDECLG